MSVEHEITKENIDIYLKDLAKTYKKLTGGKALAEIIIVGGGAILLNHDFRNATQDLDAWIDSVSAMRDAIGQVSDRYGLPVDWINTDFKNTASYSDKLQEVSTYYKTFSNVVEIRLIPDEYIIAMKMVSGRDYKHDYSDIIGIIEEDKAKGNPITHEQIENAVVTLYERLDVASQKSWELLDQALAADDLDKLFKEKDIEEEQNKDVLIHFEEDYPNKLSEGNITQILEQLQRKS